MQESHIIYCLNHLFACFLSFPPPHSLLSLLTFPHHSPVALPYQQFSCLPFFRIPTPFPSPSLFLAPHTPVSVCMLSFFPPSLPTYLPILLTVPISLRSLPLLLLNPYLHNKSLSFIYIAREKMLARVCPKDAQ